MYQVQSRGVALVHLSPENREGFRRNFSTKDCSPTTKVMALFPEFGLDRNCAMEELVRSYKVLCLKLHPDKNPGDPKATGKFQAMGNNFAECQKFVLARNLRSRPAYAKKSGTKYGHCSSARPIRVPDYWHELRQCHTAGRLG